MPERRQGLARRNHYAPEAYLRGWSDDGQRVLAYRLLVPREDYPLWERRPISRLAVWEDLYTWMEGGEERDEFERWLNRDIENPAAAALAKVRRGEPLEDQDWHRLVIYVAALDLRTPETYRILREQWIREMPRLLSRTFDRARKALRRAGPLPVQPAEDERPGPAIPLPFAVRVTPRQDDVEVRAEVTVGRQLWLHNVRQLLTGAAKVLTQHRWHILRPAPGHEWFTSDHPVIKLNFETPDKYDFGGGWDRKGGEILVPLSPHHMLYTRIRAPTHLGHSLTTDETRLMQRMVAQHASRWIIARSESQRATWWRPRICDVEVFRAEEEARQEWHESQSATDETETPGGGNPTSR
jgi:hypothetical protein